MGAARDCFEGVYGLLNILRSERFASKTNDYGRGAEVSKHGVRVAGACRLLLQKWTNRYILHRSCSPTAQSTHRGRNCQRGDIPARHMSTPWAISRAERGGVQAN